MNRGLKIGFIAGVAVVLLHFVPYLNFVPTFIGGMLEWMWELTAKGLLGLSQQTWERISMYRNLIAQSIVILILFPILGLLFSKLVRLFNTSPIASRVFFYISFTIYVGIIVLAFAVNFNTLVWVINAGRYARVTFQFILYSIPLVGLIVSLATRKNSSYFVFGLVQILLLPILFYVSLVPI